MILTRNVKVGLVVIVLALLAACTTSIPSTPTPTVAPTLSGEPSTSPGGLGSGPVLTSPVELGKKELMDANVKAICAPEPAPTWCRSVQAGGGSVTSVEASSYYVGTDLPSSDAGAKTGMEMCRDIAEATLDRDAQPIGVYRVVILDGSGLRNLAECEAP